MKDKAISPDQVLDKMAKYCACQERCVKDVCDKLKTFDISEESKKEILAYLLDNRFVNDERFTRAYVRGKINQSGWGINKIRFQLQRKGIDKELIDSAISEFDQDIYREKLITILTIKAKTIKADNVFQKRQKLAAYGIQKGFEARLVFEVMKEVMREE